MKFVIATHNQGKIVEFRRMLEPMGIEVVMAELSEPEETEKPLGKRLYQGGIRLPGNRPARRGG